MGSFYLTTAIDYPNSRPHIGTAFEKVGADVQARYRRFKGDDVFFLMGNDENTWKVAKRARELGEDPKVYCDRMAEEFKAVWRALDISFDEFIQTTEQRHREGVQHFIQMVKEAGYIEKRRYSGLYCDGCEAFKTPKEIENDRCPNHPKQELRHTEEENYFFLLSKFRIRLLNMLAPKPNGLSDLLIEPESRYNEVVNFVSYDLQPVDEPPLDISISRRNEGWGIPVPWDETQVIYVWFDALLNYMTGVGLDKEGLDLTWWPADVHFIGKDITRFHCALWPAMIMAYNEGVGGRMYAVELPKKVFAHGFINIEGRKASKSGKFLDPMELVKEFGCDAYRYYFLSRCNYASDGDYTFANFVDVYNADLANNLGNLVQRTISMVLKYFDGSIPSVGDFRNILHGGTPFADYAESVENCEYKHVLALIWSELRKMNEYIDQMKPWTLKSEPERLAQILRNLVNGLRVTAIMLKPFLPGTSRKIWESFESKKSWEDLDLGYLEDFLYRRLPEGDYNVGVSRDIVDLGRPTPLFERYENDNPRQPGNYPL
jgi:methionyl-tRNA synthetase